MDPIVPSLADYVFKCNQELGAACRQVEADRKEEFAQKSRLQRVAFHIFDKMKFVGKWGGLAAISIGTLFSTSFWLYGAVLGVAFLVGIYARRWFESLTPGEEQIVAALTNPLGIDEKNKEELPSADTFKLVRDIYINGVLNAHQLYRNGDQESLNFIQKGKLIIFVDFFGRRGLWKEMKGSLSPEGAECKQQVLERMRQLRSLYASSLLIEAVQHVAAKRLGMAKNNALKLEALGTLPFPAELANKVTLLVGKLKEPSQEFQNKVQRQIKPKFALKDLDLVAEF
jgi:hypothetical protein